MLYMSGHAGPAKTLWKKVVSGGIRQVANVRAYATWFGDRTPRKKNRERAGLPSVRGSAIHGITAQKTVRTSVQSTASIACFKSAMISSALSRPQLRRTRSMPTPASLSCSSVS